MATTGKKLRHFVNGTWELISFWHKASDCEMENGNNLEEEIQGIKDYRKNLLVHNKDTGYYQGYIDGEWRNIVNDGASLIKDGVINNGHTGGLTLRKEHTSDDILSNYDENEYEYNIHNIHIQKGSNFLSITAKIQSHNGHRPSIEATIQTVEKVDLTNYKNLYLKCNLLLLGQVIGLINIRLIKDRQLIKDKHSETYSLKEPVYDLRDIIGGIKFDSELEPPSEFSFDISDFSGKYYIGIHFYGDVNDEGQFDNIGDLEIRINDMWLN